MKPALFICLLTITFFSCSLQKEFYIGMSKNEFLSKNKGQHLLRENEYESVYSVMTKPFAYYDLYFKNDTLRSIVFSPPKEEQKIIIEKRER